MNSGLVLALGFLVRFAVPTYLLPGVTDLLDKSVLFSTPINSYRSLQEGIFLLTNGLDPYAGAIVHHPPLLLLAFAGVENETIINFLFAVVDTLIAYQIMKINDNLSIKKIGVKGDRFSSWVICLTYVLSPLALLSTFSKSTVLLSNFFILFTINNLLEGKFQIATIALSIASYLSYYPWYLLIPVIGYIYNEKKSESKDAKFVKIAFRCVTLFSIVLMATLYLSYLLTGSWQFLSTGYGSIIFFQQITPNLGIWWYFFTEIFEFFSNFYLGIFNLYSFVFVIPLTIRFRKDLIFGLWILIGFVSFAKSYPTLADLNLFYSLIFVFRPLFPKLKLSPLLSIIVIFVILTLLPVFYYVWMGLNSGNANFFYAICLVFSVVQLIVMSDFIWSRLQFEYYDKNEIDYDEKIKLTQI